VISAFGDDIADGDDLDFRIAKESTDMASSHGADADEAELDARFGIFGT
jgi:hypothetical protein